MMKTKKNRIKKLKTKKNKKIKRRNTKNIRNKHHNHNHKIKNESIMLKKVNCSPKDKNEINDFTCYTDKSLFKLNINDI